MYPIKIYAELHWGRRRPQFETRLNGQILNPKSTEVVHTFKYQEDIVFEFEGDFKKENTLEIIMRDKTDDDVGMIDNEWVDHWIKIREVELDGIKGETALYHSCEFKHSMSSEWIENMRIQGHIIEPCYPTGTDIRLNGTWSMQFITPVWQWYTERYAK